MLQCVAMNGLILGATVLELQSGSEAETIAIGRQIGLHLQSGDLILLLAPFGAGKTHLTKGIAAGLGADPDDVNSPSFVLINEYRAGPAHKGMPIFHADLYRIETAHALATTGLEDCFSGDGVCIVEWAERAGDLFPDDRLEVRIVPSGPEVRQLFLTARGSRYRALLATLSQSMSGEAP